MKRTILLSIFLILILPLFGLEPTAFLSSGENVNASTTAVNGTDFTSVEIFVARFEEKFIGAITVTFTRAAGSASTVDFEFQASYDGGTTWSTAYYVRIQVPTNETAVSNVVRATREVQFYGVSHVRLYRIVNNDGANNLTACNATLSI